MNKIRITAVVFCALGLSSCASTAPPADNVCKSIYPLHSERAGVRDKYAYLIAGYRSTIPWKRLFKIDADDSVLLIDFDEIEPRRRFEFFELLPGQYKVEKMYYGIGSTSGSPVYKTTTNYDFGWLHKSFEFEVLPKEVFKVRLDSDFEVPDFAPPPTLELPDVFGVKEYESMHMYTIDRYFRYHEAGKCDGIDVRQYLAIGN